MLGPNDKGVRVSFGVSGSGKSHGITRDVFAFVAAGHPCIVLDTMHEWQHVPRELASLTRRVSSVPNAVTRIEGGTRLAIVTSEDVAMDTEQACEWATSSPELRGVALTEAWQVAGSNERLAPGLRRVTRAWRHYNVATWLDAQRVSLLSRNVTELATELRLYAIVGDRDFAVIREIGGRALESAVRECAARLAKGEPGWHVRLGASRVPPYIVTRGAA